MIPRDYITQWRERAPWSEDFQVEQDLAISRALVAVYSDPVLAEALAFRGGTALYKLYLTPPARYSEDIDLVQVEPGPAGPLMDRLRSALDPWLGKARWKQSQGRVTFGYRFLSEDAPAMRLVSRSRSTHASILRCWASRRGLYTKVTKRAKS